MPPSTAPPTTTITHGTRGAYQAGCACRPCRTAEATYRAQLRWRHAHGQQPLGTLVPAKDAALRVRSLQIEGFSKRRLAREAGLNRETLQLGDAAQIVRLKTLLKIRRLYRVLLESP